MFIFTKRLNASHALTVFCLIVASFLCSCSKSNDDTAEATGGGAVVVGLLSDPSTLNPLASTSNQTDEILNLMFLRLVDEESDFLNFRPRLAKRWAFSDDSLSITFTLREDVVWQDGTPVTAADVRFTWELQTDTLVAWSGRNLKDRISDVKIIDDHTVTFHFQNRYPNQLMDAKEGFIVPKHILESIPREELRTSDFGRSPVGCGPFVFSNWVSGQYIELERNPLYYDEYEPYLDRVVYRIVPDMTTLVTQLKTGEIDCLESIPIDALKELQAGYPNVKVYHYLSRGMNFIAWNLEHPILKDRGVRRAIAMAVDTREMIDVLWGGMAEQSDSPMHPMLWAHDPDIERIPYDPAEARSMLNQLGWSDADGDGVLEKNGVPLAFDMMTNQGVQLRTDIMTMAQEYLRRVGIQVNLHTLEFNTFIGRVVKGEYDSCVLGWKVGTRADLTNFWRSTATAPAGFNISGYKNPQVDELIDRAKNTLDIGEARKLWSTCQRIIYEDQPILFVAVPHEVVGLEQRFCDVRPDATGFFINLHQWNIGEKCQ